jgi:hypothetical protein
MTSARAAHCERPSAHEPSRLALAVGSIACVRTARRPYRWRVWRKAKSATRNSSMVLKACAWREEGRSEAAAVFPPKMRVRSANIEFPVLAPSRPCRKPIWRSPFRRFLCIEPAARAIFSRCVRQPDRHEMNNREIEGGVDFCGGNCAGICKGHWSVLL